MLNNWLLLLAAAWISANYAYGAHILVIVPWPGISHQSVIQPLLLELANRGHQVVCYTALPPKDPPKNYKVVQMDNFLPEMKKKLFGRENEEKEDYKGFDSIMGPLFMTLNNLGPTFGEWVFKQPQIINLIKSDEKFDLVVLETTFFQEFLIGFSHKFNAPVIEYSSVGNMHWTYWLHGNPIDTSYIEDVLLPYTDKMTFIQRLHNTIHSGLMRLIWYNYYMPQSQEVMDQHMRYPGWESRPSMMDMIRNTSVVLVNSHYSINYPTPHAPHMKEVGGINIAPPKQLPKDIEDFMNSAKDGVIFFTLGSHIPVSVLLDGNVKDDFIKVFSELKQKVLWKWETDFPNLPPNIKVSKWFPQQDILAHKNMKLFITHGGLLSMTEAVYYGVPTIGIPIMVDQFRNVKHMEHYKYGLQLNLDNITYTSLKWALNEVLSNEEYTRNAKKKSQLLRDKPETGLETAVYWTEYVLRHKGAHHLKPAISTMPWYQQAMIDVYTAILLIILIPIYIIYRIVKCFVYCISCRSNKQNIVSKSKKNK